MNSSYPSLAEIFQQAWPLLGWTMILFLAAGTIVFLAGGALRIALKRANPSVRYATSLATFAVLALTPIVIAEYFASRLVPSPVELAPVETTTKYTNDTNQKASRERQRPEVNAEFAEAIPSTNPTRQRGESSVAAPTASALEFDLTRLLNQSADYLPWLWCIGTPVTFLLLATGLVGAERLRSSCQLVSAGPIRTACDELRNALGIGRQVGVAVCERIATPLLVGVIKPLILLPPAALTGWTTAELEMVLVHELAHVRRWDNAVNLAQRIVESLLFFHPAVWIVSGWVRRDREDCCDAVVVRHTAKPQAYAELLLALASHQPLAGLATSAAMAQHPVASRIRRILKLEDEPMLVTRKGFFVGVIAVVVAALLVFALPTTDAEETVSRESERVGDERAATGHTTNPTRQRGEEQTTNPTNDTNQKASRERQRPEVNAETAREAKDAETTEISAEVPGDVDQLASIKDSLRKQGFKSRFERVVAEGGRHALVVWITVPKEPKHRVVFEEHPDGLHARVILFDKSGKFINTPTDKPALDGQPYPIAAETTNPTNSTNQDLNAETAKEAEGAEKSKFPTLEEQRAADLAYKLLGVELEKLTPQELERAKANGYKGGLRVTQTKAIAENELPRADSCQYGDILVGLHVWPTESLDHITEILSRDDLDQLSPLKFYVMRHGGSGGFGGRSQTGEDHVVTGRISVDLDAWQNVRDRNVSLDPALAPSTPDFRDTSWNRRQSTLLYDGKTFDEWRSLWKTELKTEKRIECIKALAAFGRAGKGQEAAEAILDVAGEYDFGKFEGASAQDLKEAISQVMREAECIEGQYWLPLLIEQLKSDPDKWSPFSDWVLGYAQGENIIPYLKQLAIDTSLSAGVRGAALAGLAGQPDVANDAEAVAMVRKALQGDEPDMRILDRLRFFHLDLLPEQFELLLHENEQIRNHALGIARSGGTDGEAVLNKLLEILDDPARSEDREKSIITLNILNGYFINLPERRQRVTDKITELLIHGDAELLPASLMLMSTLTAKDESLVVKDLGDNVTDERRQELEAAIEKAEELKKQVIAGGGMGGMGGGGMF